MTVLQITADHVNPIVAVVDYWDEECLCPASYVQALGDAYEAIVPYEVVDDEICEMTLGVYDSCHIAVRMIWAWAHLEYQRPN